MGDEQNHVIRIETEENMQVTTDKAVTIRVLVAEIVTNVNKYAYPNGVSGNICVSLHRVAGGRMMLTVEDNGIGWSGEGVPQGSGLGTRIIKAMATNLKSEASYNAAHSGTKVAIEFDV